MHLEDRLSGTLFRYFLFFSSSLASALQATNLWAPLRECTFLLDTATGKYPLGHRHGTIPIFAGFSFLASTSGAATGMYPPFGYRTGNVSTRALPRDYTHFASLANLFTKSGHRYGNVPFFGPRNGMYPLGHRHGTIPFLACFSFSGY